MNSFAKTLIAVIIIIAALGIGAYWSLSRHNTAGKVASFEECAAAGNPVQESYPRRCTANGTTFTEEISVTPPADQPPVATSSASIRVSAPVPYQDIGVPVVIQGEARVFENVFQWRVRDEDGTILVEGHDMADAPDVGQFGPFSVTASYPAPKGDHGTVEVFAYSAKDGSEVDTVSIPVNFKNVETMSVKAFFTNEKADPGVPDCTIVHSVERRIPKTSAVAQAALNELLQGPTNTEAEQGFITNINDGTKLKSIRIDNGTAYADFDSLLNLNVGGSCRVAAIRSQIESTLKQFPTVKNVIISVNGSTEYILEP